jgi:hypothetical protein
MTAETAPTSVWDSMWTRLIAFAIAAGGCLLFIYVNEDFLKERLSGRGGEPTAYEQCLSERMAAVDQMAQAASYNEKQKELAGIRAQEYCHNQTGM